MYNKNYLINLIIINFAINSKLKLKDFNETFKKILRSKIHKFSIDGKYLKENGMQEGPLMGKVLRVVEEEWIQNNFHITKERVKEIIHSQSS